MVCTIPFLSFSLYTTHGSLTSRYKYFELPTETHLSDALKPGPVSPLWQVSNSTDPDEPSLSQEIVIPTSDEHYVKYIDEDHDVFTRLAPYTVAEKNNRNNSARSSVEFNEMVLRNLKLESDSESSISDDYVPYHLSRAENYENNDAGLDEMSVLAAENSELNLNNNEGGIQTESVNCFENGKDDKLTTLLHHSLCTKTNHREASKVHDDSKAENVNNNSSGHDTAKEYRRYYLPDYGMDVSHYGYSMQSTKRDGYLPMMQCHHKTKEAKCPTCGRKKPDLNIRDVKFPPNRMTIGPPEYNQNGGGVQYRYSGMMGGKRTMDPNPSPASTPHSSWRRLGTSDVIHIVHESNYAATATLPEIRQNKGLIYIRTPGQDFIKERDTVDDINGTDQVNTKGSNHVIALPKVDMSRSSSLVTFTNETNPGSETKADYEQPTQSATEKTKNFQDAKSGIRATRTPTYNSHGTFVKNSQTNPTVKMQVLPPQYKNSLHGSFIPYSLLKARPPTMSSRQRMELLRSKNSKTPNPGRVMVGIRLNTPSGSLRVYRKSTTALHKYANM